MKPDVSDTRAYWVSFGAFGLFFCRDSRNRVGDGYSGRT